MLTVLRQLRPERRAVAVFLLSAGICDEDVAINSVIGDEGLPLILRRGRRKSTPPFSVNVLTHCNAGWLATVDWGTALAPV